MIREDAYNKLQNECEAAKAVLVAVSKMKPAEDIEALYALGQRDFGENYVQELCRKSAALPADIRWHFIGHLQSNKVKDIASFIHLIHAVDSFKLLQEINKEAAKNSRTIDVLLQVYIAEEETKYGLDEKEIFELLEYYGAQKDSLKNVRLCGLMGLATTTENETIVQQEFARLKALFDNLRQVQFLGQQYFAICSMGMSGDYKMALREGSNMIRVGSLLFGSRG